MTEAIALAIVGLIASVVGALITQVFGRRVASADADLKRANAEQIRVGSAKTAADAMRELSDQNTALQRRASVQDRLLDDLYDANEEHERWDLVMVEALRTLRDALHAAGIHVDVGDLPDPPPLARRRSIPSEAA